MKTRIALAAAFVIPAVFLMTRGHEMPPSDRAKAACRGEIKKRLKDPGSAEFGGASVVPNDSGGWRVYREVTAKNSFGVSIKSLIVCEVTRDFNVVSVKLP